MTKFAVKTLEEAMIGYTACTGMVCYELSYASMLCKYKICC